MIGLARMAWYLAHARVAPGPAVLKFNDPPGRGFPIAREATNGAPISEEYYRIIDRISAGQQP